jgi:hypothetical protein
VNSAGAVLNPELMEHHFLREWEKVLIFRVKVRDVWQYVTQI